MKYLIDSYAPYFADGGMLDKLAEGINWLFVDMPFFLLRLSATGILIMQQLLDQSELFMSKQQDAYTLSMTILKNFGGTEIARGSIIALLLMISAYYLLYSFFVSKKNFSKVIIHYLAVFCLFIFWFGSISTPTGTKSGGMFLVDSVNSIATGVKNGFTSGSSDFSTIDSKQSLDETPLFNATIKQTFYFVNSGSLDGEMENGKKIDEKKLLMPSGLSKEKKKTFEKERTEYINSIKDENPYVEVNTNKTMEKLVAIFTGGINTLVISYPALYVNAMLSVVQLIITLLIICAPIFFLMSFVPVCQQMLFKFFKLLIGVLFFPVILGVFLAVFFWANKMIDTVYLNMMKTVASPILTLMSAGIFVLVGNVVLIIVKIFLYRSIWKNKYRLLGYFTDNQVNQPEILEKVQDKVDETKKRGKDMVVGGVETGVGMYTGNQMLVADGVGKVLPNDKAMNLGRYHFKDNGLDEPEGNKGLDEFLDNQDESKEPSLDDVEFVELDDVPMDEVDPELEVEEIDHSLDKDTMAGMFEELPDEGLEEGTTVSVDNLDEISLDADGELDELRELEQVEQETMREQIDMTVDREFPDDRFFGDAIDKELYDNLSKPVDEELFEEKD